MRTCRTLLSTLIAGVLALPGVSAAADAADRGTAPSTAVDWSAIRAEQAAFRAANPQRADAKLAGTEAEIRVSTTGWHRVAFEELLAAGINLAGVDAAHLALSQDGVKVPILVRGGASFGPGSAIEFYGKAVEGSLYTNTSVYRLKVDRRGALRFANVGVTPGLSVDASADVSIAFAPDREYNYSAPGDDPWAAARLVRSGTTSTRASESFEAAPAAAAGVATLTVNLTGGLDYGYGGNDHSARILLNGAEVGRTQFDGLSAQAFQATVPAQQLATGRNEIAIELVGDTGFGSDVVYLEGFRVDYRRALTLGEEPIRFVVDGTSRAPGFSIDGSHGDVLVLRERDGNLALAEGSLAADGSYRFAFASRAGDAVIALRPSLAMRAEVAPARAVFDPMPGAEAQLLIVSHPSFIDGLAPLVEARRQQGISTRVVNVEDLYRYYNGGRAEPAAIQAALAYAKKRLKTRYLLLVGGDSLDYKDHLGLGSVSFIPTHYVATNPTVRFAPADTLYGDVDLDGDLDIAVGRFPARTRAELDAMVAKTLDYASTPYAGKALMASDRADPGYSFRNASLAMQQNLGSAWATTRVDLDDYAASANATARADLAAAFQSGQALVSYYGHGFPTAWGNSLLLSSSNLSAIANAPATAVVQFGCWGTYFVDPRYNALSNALMAAPGAAAALIGQNGLSYTHSDIELARRLLPRLAQMRVGDAMLTTSNELGAAGGAYLDVSIGTQLMGDPTLQLRSL